MSILLWDLELEVVHWPLDLLVCQISITDPSSLVTKVANLEELFKADSFSLSKCINLGSTVL